MDHNKKREKKKSTDIITILGQKKIIAAAHELLPITTPLHSPGGKHYDILLLILPNMDEYPKVSVFELI